MQEFASAASIICTSEGNIFAWPELSQSVQQEPLQARISQEVTSLSNIVVNGYHPSTSAISGILGAADGRLYRLDCINLATSAEAILITPLQPEVSLIHLLVYDSNKLHNMSSAHAHANLVSAEKFDGFLKPVLGKTCIASCQIRSECSAADSRWAEYADSGTHQGIIGLLAGESYTPTYYSACPKSSPIVTGTFCVLERDVSHAETSGEDRPVALLQMSVQPGSSAQMLWSQAVLNTMQHQNQNLQQLSCCSLSVIAMSGSRHNVAVLASMPGDNVVLQLLSVSLKGRPEEISTHVLQLSSDVGAELSQEGSRWCCCCGRYNEVLIWRQGGIMYKWTLQTGTIFDI